MKHNKSREELIERLKEISTEEVPIERYRGAMCYSIAPPEELKTTCDYCKNTITYTGWKNDIKIPEIVDEMSRLGYDVKTAVLCNDCFKRLKSEIYLGVGDTLELDDGHTIDLSCSDRNFVFYFRTSPNEPYHCALSSFQDNYSAVLAFFKGEKSYIGYLIRHTEKFIAEEIPIIEFMTGLKIDE